MEIARAHAVESSDHCVANAHGTAAIPRVALADTRWGEEPDAERHAALCQRMNDIQPLGADASTHELQGGMCLCLSVVHRVHVRPVSLAHPGNVDGKSR